MLVKKNFNKSQLFKREPHAEKKTIFPRCFRYMLIIFLSIIARKLKIIGIFSTWTDEKNDIFTFRIRQNRELVTKPPPTKIAVFSLLDSETRRLRDSALIDVN